MKHPNTISHTISHPCHRISSLQKSNALDPIPSSNLSHGSNPDEKVIPPQPTPQPTTTLKPQPPTPSSLPLHILPYHPSRSPIHRALAPNPSPATTATKPHSSSPPPPNPSSSSAPLPHNPYRLIDTPTPPPPPPLHTPHRETTTAKRFRSMVGRMYAHLHT